MSQETFTCHCFLVCVLLTALSTGCSDEASRASGVAPPERSEVWASGSRAHDLGTVRLDDLADREISYTFELVNETDASVEIEEVVGSCGCVEARVDPLEVPAGGEFSVSLRLSVIGAGVKQERVHLLAKDRAPLSLSLRADIHADARAYGFPKYLPLSPAHEARATLAAVYSAPTPENGPPKPRIECPEGIRAEPGHWERITPPGHDDRVRWHMPITFVAERTVKPYELARVSIDGVPNPELFAFLAPVSETSDKL